MRIKDLTIDKLNDSRKDVIDRVLFHNKDFIDECDKYITETIIREFKHDQ